MKRKAAVHSWTAAFAFAGVFSDRGGSPRCQRERPVFYAEDTIRQAEVVEFHDAMKNIRSREMVGSVDGFNLHEVVTAKISAGYPGAACRTVVAYEVDVTRCFDHIIGRGGSSGDAGVTHRRSFAVCPCCVVICNEEHRNEHAVSDKIGKCERGNRKTEFSQHLLVLSS